LVEVPLLAGGEVVTPTRETVVERRERLVAVEVDALALPGDLVLEVREILLPLLAVDRGDDRGREVEDLLELARGDVEEVADAARVEFVDVHPVLAPLSLRACVVSPLSPGRRSPPARPRAVALLLRRRRAARRQRPRARPPRHRVPRPPRPPRPSAAGRLRGA